MFALTPFGRRFSVDSFNPFKEFENFERNFFGNDTIAEFKTDIREEDNAYILEADLPGFRKEDIKIDIEGDYMTITAGRKNENAQKDKKGNYIRCERSYGSFSRRFDLSGVKSEGITAAYDNGVLKLTMPKMEATLPASRQLEIQ